MSANHSMDMLIYYVDLKRFIFFDLNIRPSMNPDQILGVEDHEQGNGKLYYYLFQSLNV